MFGVNNAHSVTGNTAVKPIEEHDWSDVDEQTAREFRVCREVFHELQRRGALEGKLDGTPGLPLPTAASTHVGSPDAAP